MEVLKDIVKSWDDDDCETFMKCVKVSRELIAEGETEESMSPLVYDATEPKPTSHWKSAEPRPDAQAVSTESGTAAALEAALCALIQGYYAEHPSGGSLHIVLDDGNCEDDSIWWCVKHSITEDQDADALLLAACLLSFTTDRRFEIYEATFWGMRSVSNSEAAASIETTDALSTTTLDPSKADENAHAFIDTFATSPQAPQTRDEVIEECAKVAQSHFIYGQSIAGPHFAKACADKIRALKSQPSGGA